MSAEGHLPVPVVQEPVTIVIVLQPSGNLDFTGPLQNGILCFGMLTMALALVNDHRSREKGRIVLPRL